MKTYINNQSKNAMCFMFLVCSSFLLLAGCEKSDMQPVSNENGSGSEMKKAYLPPPVYSILMIEHNCLNTSLPDYDVYLNSDGSVTYRGWSNVAHKGTVEFKTDAATVSFIKNIFEAANFFNIQPITPQYDDPYIKTTYRNLYAVKSLIDYDQGMPQILIQLRKTAEEKLHIARLVEFKKYTGIPAGYN
jgi:hypothetical protein